MTCTTAEVDGILLVDRAHKNNISLYQVCFNYCIIGRVVLPPKAVSFIIVSYAAEQLDFGVVHGKLSACDDKIGAGRFYCIYCVFSKSCVTYPSLNGYGESHVQLDFQ